MMNHSSFLRAHPATANAGLLALLITFGSIGLLHAETGDKKTASEMTNVVAMPETASSAAKIAAPVVVTRKADDDSDDDDSSSHGHPHTFISINDGAEHEHSSSPDDAGDDVAKVLSVVGVFGMPVLIVFFVVFFRYRRRRENLAMAREFLSKGLPIPPQLLDESRRAEESPVAALGHGAVDRRKGIKLLAIGVGISLALYFASWHSRDWAWGLILVVMGLGYLISGWIDARQAAKDNRIPPAGPPL